MKRLLALASTFTLIFALAPSAFAAPPDKMNSMSASHNSMMMHSCAKGKHWVHGYTKKDGTKVKGYCAKDPMAKSKM